MHNNNYNNIYNEYILHTPMVAGMCIVTSFAAIRAPDLNPALFCRADSSLDRIFFRVFLNSVQAGRPAPIRAFSVV